MSSGNGQDPLPPNLTAVQMRDRMIAAYPEREATIRKRHEVLERFCAERGLNIDDTLSGEQIVEMRQDPEWKAAEQLSRVQLTEEQRQDALDRVRHAIRVGGRRYRSAMQRPVESNGRKKLLAEAEAQVATAMAAAFELGIRQDEFPQWAHDLAISNDEHRRTAAEQRATVADETSKGASG